MVSNGRTSQRRPNCIDPHRRHTGLRLAHPFCRVLWTTDEITSLEKVPSPNVGGPISVMQFLNMDYGVSVLGGPLLITKVPWTTSKFKATSYYSVHPEIFVGYYTACVFPNGVGLGRYLPTWLTQVDSRQAAFNVQAHTHIIIDGNETGQMLLVWGKCHHQMSGRPFLLHSFYGLWGVGLRAPYRLLRFPEPLQSSRQLLTTLFIR